MPKGWEVFDNRIASYRVLTTTWTRWGARRLCERFERRGEFPHLAVDFGRVGES